MCHQLIESIFLLSLGIPQEFIYPGVIDIYPGGLDIKDHILVLEKVYLTLRYVRYPVGRFHALKGLSWKLHSRSQNSFRILIIKSHSWNHLGH